MKKIIFILLLIPYIGYSQSKDLKAEINQTTFDKIINSVKYPYVLVEHKEPFPGFMSSSDISDITGDFEDDKSYTPDEIKALLKWAIEGQTSSTLDNSKDGEVFRTGIRNAWDNFKEEIDQVLSNTQISMAGGDYSADEVRKWKTYSLEKLFDELQQSEMRKAKKGFEVKAHLAYARVDLLEGPKLIVNSPSFDINNISVRPTATGELWMKMPHLSCCPLRVEWRWHKVASLTISIKLAASVNINFSIDAFKIFATGQFKSLVLNYPILREINFAGIINRSLANKKFELYDVSKFVASIPYIEKKFRISEINLPPSAVSVIVTINVTQTSQ